MPQNYATPPDGRVAKQQNRGVKTTKKELFPLCPRFGRKAGSAREYADEIALVGESDPLGNFAHGDTGTVAVGAKEQKRRKREKVGERSRLAIYLKNIYLCGICNRNVFPCGSICLRWF